jgi:hypothetical protein
LPETLAQRVEIEQSDIYLTYEGVDPLDIALFARLGWHNEHSTRRITVDIFGDYYEGELPRIARSLVWDYRHGRTVKPMGFTLDLHRIRSSDKIQHCKEMFRGNQAGQ